MPAIWKPANVTPILKSVAPSFLGEYTKLQHGFLQDRNCITQLLQVYHKILSTLDNKEGEEEEETTLFIQGSSISSKADINGGPVLRILRSRTYKHNSKILTRINKKLKSKKTLGIMLFC